MYAQILSCTTYRLSKDRRLRELCRTVGCACVAHNQIQWSRRFQESLRVQSAFDVMKNPVVRGLQKKRALELGFHCAMPDDDAMLFKKFKKSKIKNQKSKINPLSVGHSVFCFSLYLRHVRLIRRTSTFAIITCNVCALHGRTTAFLCTPCIYTCVL